MADNIQTMQDAGIQGQLSQISIELGKQSTQLAVVIEKLTTLTVSMNDHESRIRTVEGSMPLNLDSRLLALESAKAKIFGAAMGTGALSGAAATIIYWALSHH